MRKIQLWSSIHTNITFKMVIGFKERFIKPILARTKLHTIRGDSHNRWKIGMRMHMATGVRTKKYNQFNEEICKSVQKIKIYSYPEIIIIDGRKLSYPEISDLSKNDGFESIDEFWSWFYPDFEGKIIHWTELKY